MQWWGKNYTINCTPKWHYIVIFTNEYKQDSKKHTFLKATNKNSFGLCSFGAGGSSSTVPKPLEPQANNRSSTCRDGVAGMAGLV